jgi:hypothetical protein
VDGLDLVEVVGRSEKRGNNTHAEANLLVLILRFVGSIHTM